MLNITYLSDEDRARLLALQEKMPRAEDVEEQRDIRTEIRDIESKRKPLHECNLEECTDLRMQIWGKFDRLNRTGKYGLAMQFKQMLVAIENRMRALHMEQAREERERQEQKLAAAKSKRKEVKDEGSKPRSRSKSMSSRWTTGIGSLD